MMRLFVGLGISKEAREMLHHAVSSLGVRGRMTEPGNYHLTLAFLGEHDERIRPLETVLADAARSCAPFSLSVTGLGFFGRRSSAILHAKLANSAPLQTLADTVHTRLTQAGEPYDGKPFAPHITLARQADLTDLNLQTPLPQVSFPVNRLTLYHSARMEGILRYRPVFEAFFEKEASRV
ncbi:MAG TPA: RNA 2',3'-cyclic phosphodiesterase [Candidatus Limiplasma sp.]|nr:RNA 2',3'-cyclic phosphodiesterase [Candidatus Limiplasma sp.]HRX09061.1 RNA 2',3'-cyclic phosphodiesterase [Candidatus Limiplasma sp.]